MFVGVGGCIRRYGSRMIVEFERGLEWGCADSKTGCAAVLYDRGGINGSWGWLVS